MAKILVVDDDPQIGELLAEFLESLGHKVISAQNGQGALELIYSRRFDLTLLDINLPQMSGIELLSIIRKQSPQTMVIMISGQADLDSAIEALKKGAFDYIKKPLILKVLENTISHALAEAQIMKSYSYIYKDSRRDDRNLVRDGIVYAITDSIIAGLTFFIGFIIQAYLFSRVQVPLFLGSIELYQMSLGLAFCYAFIFVFRKGHRIDLINSLGDLANQLFGNIVYSYILYISVLFLFKNISFITFKFAVGAGFLSCLIGLMANRIIFMPVLFAGRQKNSGKNIVLEDSNHAAGNSHMAAKRKLTLKMPKPSQQEIEREIVNSEAPRVRTLANPNELESLSSNNIDELHITGDTFTPEDIARVMDRLHDRKTKVAILDSLSKSVNVPNMRSM